MKRLVLSALIAVLASGLAAAQELMGLVRSGNFEAPSAGEGLPVILADYRRVDNPGYVDPNTLPQPPNLTKKHIDRLIDLMVEAELSKRPALRRPYEQDQRVPLTLTKEQVLWIGGLLSMIDRNYVNAIPGEVWDKAVEDMGKVAAEKFRFSKGKGNWEETGNAMINAVARNILDPFSVYWNKEEYKRFQDDSNNSFVGVGLLLGEDGSIDIVIPRSPAEKAGLQSGDKIVAVDGKAVSTREQVSLRARGRAGTSVRLTVLRGGGRLDIVAARAEIETRNVYAKMAAPGVGYVYLGQFSNDSDEELISAVADLQAKGAGKLILDVRGNPGGGVAAVSQIASEFFKDGQKIVSFKRQGRVMPENVTRGAGRCLGRKVAI
ncbi:MAG: PDZ domain-containing protein, partial [Elusimicrobia bacterium]|nr:PDZ domain-containing protein [Elusimicrobiota bacterium]